MDENTIFRLPFIKSFLFVFAGGFLLVFIDDGFDINMEAFVFATFAVFVLTAIYVYFCKYTVTTSAIQGYNVWGKKLSMQWGDIARIKPINFIGIKYIKIYSPTSKQPIWLPLFLNNMSKFIQLTDTYANKNNPIMVYLNNNEYA